RPGLLAARYRPGTAADHGGGRFPAPCGLSGSAGHAPSAPQAAFAAKIGHFNDKRVDMLLLVDAGNTRVKWALAEDRAEPGRWLDHGWVARTQVRELRQVFAARPATCALVSNVAGAALREDLEQLLLASGLKSGDIEW